MEISASTDADALVGNTYHTQHFPDDPFTVINAGHAPELNAVGYSAHDEQTGWPFVAFAPYGSEMTEEGPA